MSSPKKFTLTCSQGTFLSVETPKDVNQKAVFMLNSFLPPSIKENRERMADTGIPPLLILITVVGSGGEFWTFLYPFFLIDPPLITILFSIPVTLITFYCLFKIVLMRRKALLVYIGLFILNQAVLLLSGIWSKYLVIIPSLVILTGLLYWRNFE